MLQMLSPDDTTDALMSALQVDEEGAVCWPELLQTMADLTGARAVCMQLSSYHQALSCNYPELLPATVNTDTPQRLEISGPDYLLQARFLECETLDPALEAPLANVLEVALHLQLHSWRNQVFQAAGRQLQFEHVTLDVRGKLQGPLPFLWMQAGLSIDQDGRLLLKGESDWLERSLTQLANATSAGDSIVGCTLPLPHHNRELASSVQCVLTRSAIKPLKGSSQHYSLFLFNGADCFDPEHIRQWLDINESEAWLALLFARGLSAKAIVQHTGYSQHTVYAYVKTLYKKLGINSQSQLTQKFLSLAAGYSLPS